LDGNRHDVNLNSSLHCYSIISGNLNTLRNSEAGGSSVIASAILSSVGVFGLVLSVVKFQVSECKDSVTTAATIASLDTINELLFRELLENVGFDKVGSLI